MREDNTMKIISCELIKIVFMIDIEILDPVQEEMENHDEREQVTRKFCSFKVF